MIPVTTFAGRRVALFGLGASGLASASALTAGGAGIVAFDDDAGRVAAAAAAGIPTADLRQLDWSKIAALVLTPGVPLTHPAPHWAVGLARNAAVEVIGDIELYCRERRRLAPDAAFVAITGTNGKSTTTALVAHLLNAAGYEAEQGGNIGTAILSLTAPAPGRAHVIECSSYQIDLAPSLDPSVGILLNVSEDHLDRHGTLANYAAVKERLVAGVPPSGTAIVGVDDNWCQAVADRLEQRGRRVVRVSVRQPLAHGLYVEGRPDHAGDRRHRARDRAHRRHRFVARRAQCAERGVRDRRGARARLVAIRDPAGLALVSRPRAPHGAGRRARATCCSSTIPRRPMRTRRRARSQASPTFSGSPAARRRPAASRASPDISRASARPI